MQGKPQKRPQQPITYTSSCNRTETRSKSLHLTVTEAPQGQPQFPNSTSTSRLLGPAPCRIASRCRSTKEATCKRSPALPPHFRQWNRPQAMLHTHSQCSHGWNDSFVFTCLLVFIIGGASLNILKLRLQVQNLSTRPDCIVLEFTHYIDSVPQLTQWKTALVINNSMENDTTLASTDTIWAGLGTKSDKDPSAVQLPRRKYCSFHMPMQQISCWQPTKSALPWRPWQRSVPKLKQPKHFVPLALSIDSQPPLKDKIVHIWGACYAGSVSLLGFQHDWSFKLAVQMAVRIGVFKQFKPAFFCSNSYNWHDASNKFNQWATVRGKKRKTFFAFGQLTRTWPSDHRHVAESIGRPGVNVKKMVCPTPLSMFFSIRSWSRQTSRKVPPLCSTGNILIYIYIYIYISLERRQRFPCSSKNSASTPPVCIFAPCKIPKLQVWVFIFNLTWTCTKTADNPHDRTNPTNFPEM